MASPSPDDSGLVPVGQLLDGRYRIESILGKGGMGKVYKAEHMGIGRMVAIKVLHARLGGSKEASQRFQREAKAMARLDHPNIVNVTDTGALADGSLFLVMEALEGEPLGDRLARDQRLPWTAALAVMRGLLAGLKHAHDKGVVHRDIKPDNIFLANKDGEVVVKILDFGIAKLVVGNADDPATTRAGLTVGTPAYLSPEQAVGGAITPATDLYSASIVLYEMLTGRPPFLDDDPLAMLTAHVSRDVPPIAEVAPDVQLPPGLEDVLQRGLAKVSAERISSAVDYAQQLDDVSRAAGVDLAMVPRASGQLPIPAGPHAFATPMPGSFLMTPATPMPTVSSAQSANTPTPFPNATPAPSELAAAAATLGSLPQPARLISVAEIKEPLPRKLKLVGFAIVGLALLITVIVALSGGDKNSAAPAKAGGMLTPSPEELEMRLKAAIHDLETGKTCADRKSAIPAILSVGGDKAIAALRRARYRMRGGVLGIGDSNTNACLKADAERAIQQLGATLR